MKCAPMPGKARCRRERGNVTDAAQREAAAELCSLLVPEATGHHALSDNRTANRRLNQPIGIKHTNSYSVGLEYNIKRNLSIENNNVTRPPNALLDYSGKVKYRRNRSIWVRSNSVMTQWQLINRLGNRTVQKLR